MASREVELALLTRVAETGDFRSLVTGRITRASFTDEDARDVFQVMQRRVAKFGATPSVAVLRDAVPSFAAVETSDTVEALVGQVRSAELYGRIMEAVENVGIGARGDPIEALQALQKASATLGVEFSDSRDVDVAATADDVLARYAEAETRGGVLGLPWAWEHLNQITRGLRGGQYIVWYAQPKTYKTWLMLYQAFTLHKNLGTAVVFAVRETPVEDVQDMVACLYAGVEWTAFYTARLTDVEKRRLREGVEQFRDGAPFNVIDVDAQGLGAVEQLGAKIQEYEAEILFVDGIYLLADDADWTSVAKINRATKQLAKRRGIPIVASTQANEEGRVGYKTFQQDCDALFQLVAEDEHRAQREVLIEPKMMRQAVGTPFTVHARPALNFNQKAVVRAGEKPGVKDDDDVSDDESAFEEEENES